MTKLLELLGRESRRDLELPLQSLLPHPLQPLRARHRQSRIGQPAVGRIVDALHQAIALEMIDEAGDVARGNLQLVGQLPEGQLPFRCGLQRPKDVQAALAQAMLVGPAIHEPMSQPGGNAQRRHGLNRAHLLFRQRPACRPECVAEAAVIQASGSVASQRAVEPTLAFDLRELHSEVVHYVPLRVDCQTTSSASPHPTLPASGEENFMSGAGFADAGRRWPPCAEGSQRSAPAAPSNSGRGPRGSTCATRQRSAASSRVPSCSRER